MSNPWQALDHSRVDEFTANRSERAVEHALTDGEYRDAPAPLPCTSGCGGTMYWRATVGALQCDRRCGALANSSGKPYGRR